MPRSLSRPCPARCTVSATRKMLGSSWVTMTIVMPRSRLSVRMSWSSSTAEIGSSPADGSSKNRRSGSSIRARAMPARFFMPPEISPGRCSANAPRPDEVELGLDELPHRRTADRGPCGQGKREVLRQRHRAEERARLKEHAEGRHALVAMRLSNAVDVDPPGLRLFKSNQVAQQRALAAP